MAKGRRITQAEIEEYIREQVKRLSDMYSVKFTERDILAVCNFEEEHLADSHAVCDLIELIAKVKSAKNGRNP